jgi:hypothetical protein
MYKPDSLRAHLTAANPDLKRDPDKLLVFVDEGRLIATGTHSRSFEYAYKINVIITDFGDERRCHHGAVAGLGWSPSARVAG